MSERALAELFGATTLARGQEYAKQGRVGHITVAQGGASTIVQAEVRGSAFRSYHTVVTRTAGTGTLVATCTCPVRSRCKHSAALLWHMRTVSVRAATPSWQRALSEIAESARPAERGEPLALQVTRGGPGVALRPMVWGRSERWVRAGITWDNVQQPWMHQFLEEHRTALAGLARTRNERSSGYYSRRQDELWLGELGPGAWDWLRAAVAAGVELVPGRDTGAVRIADQPAVLASRLSRTEGGVRLRTVARSGEFERAVPYADLIGEPPHGFVVDSGDELVLVPFAEPLSKGQQALLLRHSRLDIPEDDLPAFAAQYPPTLRRMVALEIDPDVELPEAEPPRLRLTVGFEPDHVAQLAWAYRYTVGEHAFDVDLEPVGSQPVLRDPDAEEALLAALPEGPWPLVDVAAGLRRPLERARLIGPDTALLVEQGIPSLTRAGVIVETTGQAADYRLATEAPEVRVEVADPAHGSDWFNLDVEVSIEGEPIEYRELFTALATGQTHLILPSGTWFSLERPELQQLRALIAEAQEFAADGTGQLRLRTEHAGLWDELVSLGVVARQSAAWQQAVSALLDLEQLPEVDPPPGLRATLRPYQLHGFRWLHYLYTARLGGILADDMGLGKTMQALALACALAQEGEREAPMLVVAPTSVLGTWAAEAARFAPGLRVRVVTGTAKRRAESLAELAAGADLVVTSYTLLRLDEAEYVAQPWQVVLLDEAQFVKNRQARGYQSVRKLSARTKFAITGTPLENNLMDLWSLLSIVAPGLFADPISFGERYRKPIESGSDPDALARLHRRVRPLMLRRTKETVAAELPEKQEQVLSIELTPGHRRLYDKQLAVERKKVLGLVDDLGRNRITILSSLTTLRQLALSPALVLPDQAAVSAKVDTLIELVGELAAEGHRALVFSQFTRYLKLVRDRLEDEGIGTTYLDGRTRDRADRIARFRAGDDPVFLISLKAGGFGLTLTEADYVFILDPWWNPAAELQAIDRTHRIGQDKPVMVYRLVSADTIEEKVVALQQRKRDLFAKVVGEAGDLAAPLTADDIRGLLEG
ncbi:DEAD/DEAH box helicase [Micropruina sonneratiae]|uniref:DEAD/DEAH box helicase n=1 Tax=Micropruina sonneratiae TaxID=2986940 RepID=UPI00222713CF|nr:DEAD/DEAH box helicase [Micropruina sp. KQZ13P-5]